MTQHLDPTTAQLLAHLHRGGDYKYFWRLVGKRSTWWNGTGPPELPCDTDLYFGVHPSCEIPTTDKDGKPVDPWFARSRIETIATVNALYGEHDAKDFGDSKAQALGHVTGLLVPPSVCANSGGGYHSYWLLKEPFIIKTDADRAYIADIQRRWVAFVRSDKASKDLARVLRVPGTHNGKYPDLPLVTYEWANLNVCHDLAALVALLPAEDTTRTAPTPPRADAPTDRDLSPYLRSALAGEVANVVGAIDGTKHDTLRDAAIKLGTLIAHGLDEDMAATALYDAICDRAADPRNAWATIQDGIAYGKARPRDIPDRPALTAPASGTSAPAANGQASAPAAPPAPRFTVTIEDELFNLPPLRYLDRDLGLVAGAFHLIYGASGSGKTFYAIERAMRQASAGKRVLYIPTEDVSGLRYRIAAWRQAHPEVSGRLTWLQMPQGLDLQDHKQVAELIETIEPFQYDHIVLDTLREAHSGDENSSQDTARINRAIQRLVATGAAVDVVHHTGVAGERPRGSTALFGNCDVVIKVENDDGLIRASFDKIRNAAPRDGIAFGLVVQDTGMIDSDGEHIASAILRPAAQFTRRDAPMSQAARRILETLSLSIFSQTGAKTRQLVEAAQLPENKSLYRALSWLKDRSFIHQGTKGDPYYITPAGLAQLGPEYLSLSSGSFDSDSTPLTDGGGSDSAAQKEQATVNADTAAARPTVATVTPLSPTVRQGADTHPVLSVTVTTRRGDSADSGVTGDNRQMTGRDPYRVTEWDEDPPRYTIGQWTDAGFTDLPGEYSTLDAARAAMPDPPLRAGIPLHRQNVNVQHMREADELAAIAARDEELNL